MTTTANPSYVFYRRWRPGLGWGAETGLDDSFQGPDRVGGRHPSLALGPGGRVWAAWQDHRHGTAPGTFIDNIELYATVIENGAESGSDIRLTSTTAPHNGDNGYVPKLAAGPGGSIHLGWYDFHANATVADVYLASWDGAGTAPAVMESLGPFRATDYTERGGTPSFTVASVAVDATGTRHLAWAGGEAAGVNLYYGQVPDGGTTAAVTLLAAGATDYFDPPTVAAGPDGTVWLAWGDDTVVGQEEVKLARLAPGGTLFDAAVTLAPDPARQFAPSLAPSADGKVHMAWVDFRGGRHIRYGLYDPSLPGLVEEIAVTSGLSTCERPVVVLDGEGRPHIVFERRISSSSGEIWHVPPGNLSAAGPDWMLFQ